MTKSDEIREAFVRLMIEHPMPDDEILAVIETLALILVTIEKREERKT